MTPLGAADGFDPRRRVQLFGLGRGPDTPPGSRRFPGPVVGLSV